MRRASAMSTRMPWEFCHVHAIDDEGCERNRRFVQYLKGWQAVSANVSVYDYYGHFRVFAPWTMPRHSSV